MGRCQTFCDVRNDHIAAPNHAVPWAACIIISFSSVFQLYHPFDLSDCVCEALRHVGAAGLSLHISNRLTNMMITVPKNRG